MEDGYSSDRGGSDEFHLGDFHEFLEDIGKVRDNDPDFVKLRWYISDNYYNINSMKDETWAALGRKISNNTHLKELDFSGGMLDNNVISLFQTLTQSCSIEGLCLSENGLSAAGLRNMVPFLHNSRSLRTLVLNNNDIGAEGCNFLFRALHDSSVEILNCCNCGIETLDIDSDHLPGNLKKLFIEDNAINADGCRELAKLLQGTNSILQELHLDNNKIDDDKEFPFWSMPYEIIQH